MKQLREAMDDMLEEFETDENSIGTMTVGEFVYRLVIAMVHAGMQDIADFLKPMGEVVIADRQEESLFGITVDEGETEGE